MALYLFNLVLVPFWSFFGYGINDHVRRNQIISWILFSQLFIFMAFRSPYISYDTQKYLDIFYNVKNIDFLDYKSLLSVTTFEIGYSYINKLLSYVSLSSFWYISVMSLLTLYLIKKSIDKNSKIIWLSYYLLISLGFYTSFFSMIRQGLAMALIMYSYNFLSKDTRYKFVFIVIIAFFIHQTAAIFFIMYLIIDKKISNKTIVFSFISMPIVYVFGSDILNFLFQNTKYSTRLERALSGEGQLLLLIYIVIFIAAILLKKQVVEKDKNDNTLYYLAVFSIICQLLALNFSLFSRVGLYFSIFQILLIPNALSSINNKMLRIISIYFVILTTPLLLYVNLEKNLGGIVPYLFLWQ
ncbi:EpsG family protein [Paenibacillus sp. J5C_2022]|uniref:EpsG family protein n=1 Tax=Paenibacillus sp. J5C2022 TaxID=2977129 RepID=UPI0021D15610|nr:EpsG family protein [Paenibacillus sp. J5C2022]MCU6708776.1 EpsG family protein [Paenibacillus sp. J5C2022]